jgi:hypothetical protein
MKKNHAELGIRLLRQILDGWMHREREGGRAVAQPSIVVGRVVRTPKYGKGFIAEIEGSAVKVRFWKHGYKTFHPIEGKYSFEAIHEVRPIKQKSEVERVLARETSAEKRERKYRCQHGGIRGLCLKCEEAMEGSLKKWDKHRTRERHINPSGLSLNCYVPVRISTNDCELISRPVSSVSEKVISSWYECLQCGIVTESAHSGEELTLCEICGGEVRAIPEPFQNSQFSREIGAGAKRGSYADAKPIQRVSSPEASIARDLFADPNSRFQAGGTGYLRIPLDEARSTRADAPEWLDCRESFLQTLRKSRSERAERILCGFYVEQKTDEQIAKEIGWTKDAVKKERKQLLENGSNFFRLAAKHPPSPAMGEKTENHPNCSSLSPNYPHSNAKVETAIPSSSPRKAYPVVRTHLVAVCSPQPNVLRVYPIFDADGVPLAEIGGQYERVTDLDGFLREELAIPRDRRNTATEVFDEQMSG